jgi:cytochrome b pre-mRNA-processing protein 3
MALLDRIFGGGKPRAALEPLYRALVAEARDPFWYRAGGVPDTIDGRFDMVSSVLALVLLRLERDGQATRDETVLLTEQFIDDMDGTVRQIGIGDQLVGKHVGKMMGALGGRLDAFRKSAGDPDAFAAAVRRNIFREDPPSEDAVKLVAERLAGLSARLDAADSAAILRGELPR